MKRRIPRSPVAALAALALGGCGAWTGGGPGCRALVAPAALDHEITESSGVVFASMDEDVVWTINDSGRALLYAVGTDGRIATRVRVEGARHQDWEDLSRAPCGSGSCLYIADVGDNDAERDTVFVYRVAEPALQGQEAVTAERFPILLPEGPRNVESMFVLPDESLYLVGKGSDHPVAVYRYPGPLRPDVAVTLEEVQRLSDGARALPRQVTGAAATADGQVVTLRTYESLLFHSFEDGRLRPLSDGRVNLRTLQEAQGEAVAIGEGGRVVVTSEAGPVHPAGSLALLRCDLDAGIGK